MVGYIGVYVDSCEREWDMLLHIQQQVMSVCVHRFLFLPVQCCVRIIHSLLTACACILSRVNQVGRGLFFLSAGIAGASI
jgi:hypothetical protein